LPGDAVSAPDGEVYVALGDSMSIDEYAGGPGRGAASLFFRNLDTNFPEWAGRDLASRDAGARMHLLAVDGGTSRDVATIQLPTLREASVRPTVATLTMGGNDLLMSFGDSAAARRAIGNVAAYGREVLGGLRELMGPEAPIVVGTVYDPSDGAGDGAFQDLGSWPDVLDVLEELNGELRALAEIHGALVADLHARFIGHGLMAGNPAQPDARPADRNLWYCGLIEPNAWGAGAIRAAFWEALEGARS
jgi:lysophospholipase L1-like esterase